MIPRQTSRKTSGTRMSAPWPSKTWMLRMWTSGMEDMEDVDKRDVDDEDMDERDVDERDVDERDVDEEDLDERDVEEEDVDEEGVDEENADEEEDVPHKGTLYLSQHGSTDRSAQEVDRMTKAGAGVTQQGGSVVVSFTKSHFTANRKRLRLSARLSFMHQPGAASSSTNSTLASAS